MITFAPLTRHLRLEAGTNNFYPNCKTFRKAQLLLAHSIYNQQEYQMVEALERIQAQPCYELQLQHLYLPENPISVRHI